MLTHSNFSPALLLLEEASEVRRRVLGNRNLRLVVDKPLKLPVLDVVAGCGPLAVVHDSRHVVEELRQVATSEASRMEGCVLTTLETVVEK